MKLPEVKEFSRLLGYAGNSAECRRTGCGYIRNVACTVVSHKLLTDDQNMLELTLCLVCGGGGNIAFARVANASAKAED